MEVEGLSNPSQNYLKNSLFQRHFTSDLQPIETTRKTLTISNGARSRAQRADKCYLVLVKCKERKRQERATET